MHTPWHQSDSICLYAPQIQAIFPGDTQLVLTSPGGEYPGGYLNSLKRITSKKIRTIYPGHDKPITREVQEKILATVAMMQGSQAQQMT